MITDAEIKSAIANAPKTKKAIELKDSAERGAGRLVLVIRPFPSRVSAEWYVYSFRGGRRSSLKIGSYPALPLAAARKTFREEYAPEIYGGSTLTALRKRAGYRDPTFGVLVENYIRSLEGRPSQRTISNALAAAVKYFGDARPAAAITTQEFAEFLRQIYERGAVVHADMTRAYLRAAYQKAIRSVNDYTTRWKVKDWGFTVNPLSDIPFDPRARRAGKRSLSASEWAMYYRWLEANEKKWPLARAVRLCMLTGQRLIEILNLEIQQYDPDGGTLYWSKTKNGLPHCIPLPRQAVGIMNELANRPRPQGRLFPRRGKSVSYGSVTRLTKAFSEENREIKPFSSRDIRRTWKTLAGAAGLSREIRDRLQNHALLDVSSRHYDRYEYLDEKRAAMSRWSDYVDEVMALPVGAVSPIIAMSALVAPDSGLQAQTESGFARERMRKLFRTGNAKAATAPELV